MNPQVLNLVKAIAYNENGGKLNVKNIQKGKTGEMKSVFQFTPATWKNYSKQITGRELPMTPENESLVTYKKIDEWLKNGYKPEQVLSMWNAGPGESDAYSGKFSDGSPSKGTNKKYGVSYDVPGYVNKGMKYFNQFSSNAPQQNQQPVNNSNLNPGLLKPNPVEQQFEQAVSGSESPSTS